MKVQEHMNQLNHLVKTKVLKKKMIHKNEYII